MIRSFVEVVQAGLVRQVPTQLHALAPAPLWLYMQSTLYTIATAVLPRVLKDEEIQLLNRLQEEKPGLVVDLTWHTEEDERS